MPTATPFTALGAGNGFPACLTKVNIQDYSHWTTLSGWSKEEEPLNKPESINQSRELAMKLFWNLNGVTGTRGFGTAPSVTVDLDGGNFDNAYWREIHGDPPGTISGVNKEPHERVCYSRWSASTGFVEDEYGDTSDGVIASGRVYRMYDGDVSSETNFVGYGAAGFTWESISFFTSFYLSYRTQSPNNNDAAEYVEFNGMHFVGEVYINFFPDENASITGGTTATATISPPDPYPDYTLATLSSLTFYTY